MDCADVQTVETNPYMGHDLHATFVQAALPPPTMELRALIQGPTERNRLLRDDRGARDHDGAGDGEGGYRRPGEIDATTFPRPMREEVERLASVVIGRSEIGAWSRKP